MTLPRQSPVRRGLRHQSSPKRYRPLAKSVPVALGVARAIDWRTAARAVDVRLRLQSCAEPAVAPPELIRVDATVGTGAGAGGAEQASEDHQSCCFHAPTLRGARRHRQSPASRARGDELTRRSPGINRRESCGGQGCIEPTWTPLRNRRGCVAAAETITAMR